PQLALVENPDILADVAARGQGRPRLVVGFAAETEDLLHHAREKLARKRVDAQGERRQGGSGMKVEIRRFPHGEGLDLPFYATGGSAGLDVCAALPPGSKLVLEPGARDLV